MADRAAGRLAGAWWSRRFLDVIEGLGLADALRAGRRLVRTEAVLDLRRSGNLVVALVRGPDDETYKARVAVRTFSGTTWTRVEQALAARAGYAATLLAGSMPAEIDRVFAALGLSLFPTGVDDLAMDCTCDDWQRPCAHIAAACYQLAESLDRDPFGLLALRGRERDPFLDGLRTHRPGPVPAGPDVVPASPDIVPAPDDQTPHPDGPPRGAADHTSADDRLGAATGPAGLPGLLGLRGPLVVEPLGDLRELLRPAYLAFATARPESRPPPGEHRPPPT